MMRKPIWPYLLVGLLSFILAQSLYAYYQLSIQAVPFIGILRLNWLLENWPLFSLMLSLEPEALMTGLVGFGLPMLLYVSGDRSFYRHGEEQGSARFATLREMKRFEDKDSDKNMIFTKQVKMGLFNFRLAYNVQLNKNVIVIGLPGDGKTFTFVLPNLMQLNSNFVVTDPKGSLVHETGKMLERHGYAVKVFDLIHLKNSDRFNPFHYMKSELDIDRISEAITEGTKKSEHMGEDFWVQAELMLQRALIGYLYFDSKDPETGAQLYMPNLGHVADLLRGIYREDPDVPSPVEQMFEELEELQPGNYAYKQWKLFQNFKGETRNSVVAILSSRYSIFDHDDVRKLISDDTLEIDTWNTKKTAVFIAIPETNNAFNFLSSILFAVGFEVLTHKADDILHGRVPDYSRKNLRHIQFILDEFAQIGRIPNFTQILSSIRSREMSIKIILQAVNQLESLYKSDWKTIFNNCATHVFLGTNDEDTMKYYSTRAGKQTIRTRSTSKSHSYRNGSSSENKQIQGRPLLTPDEVARIGVEEGLVFISKQNVFRDQKANVYDHPRQGEIAHSPEDDNWYDYQRLGTDIDGLLLHAQDLEPQLEALFAA
ncbi:MULTISPECIES: VirD4-like conjugal transfer protein, CD1115 family [unclassified Streptococcus]|uniref:VirD4-like conjugal transfer protein, CD1115 family n=1 Tax=unclassified Streptococcus TaxID=2608887 RepID=UPI00107278D7|nr:MULTISPECIES: type IV secretory system conjugative DNA transfer family protein [unclassified Streptococcus]MBF0786670.1 type IV secretory system conjugative DNA transfer family protein [Streptococcus sp. 19428wC2_LYSM12]MCQ9211707.1 type IV secretory system conjugative DNA transfer family protein [Streptococcus sp. B01]MCQ9213104.1 type IV secretory system conjugative DNA transfer family protein [Streptococcus sp. O1]TFV06422.1 conjugal transfer protein TraG [Streptococcus sp. LYSM12]